MAVENNFVTPEVDEYDSVEFPDTGDSFVVENNTPEEELVDLPDGFTEEPFREEKPPKEEAKTEAPPKEEEPKGDLEDSFADFEIEEDKATLAPEASKIFDELNIEGVKSVSDLKNHIESLAASAKVQTTNDTELNAHIDSVKKIHQAGGDWRSYINQKEEVHTLENKIGQYKSDLAYYSSMVLSEDESKLSNFLYEAEKVRLNRSIAHMENTPQLQAQVQNKLNAFKDRLESLDVTELSAKAGSVAEQYMQLTNNAIAAGEDNLGKLKSDIANAASIAEQNFNTAKTKFMADIGTYKSNVSNKFTPLVQKASIAMFNSEPANVTLPKDLVKEFFLDDAGKVSATKIAEMVERLRYGKRQLEYLANSKTIKNFRESRNPQKRNDGFAPVGNAGGADEYDVYEPN